MSSSLSRKLRKTPTTAEKRLWRLMFPLRTNGFHFRKQVAIGPYVADFACHHANLVIEVDGDTHGGDLARSHDARRTAYLNERGYSVLRFSNADILHNPEGVYQVIEEVLEGRERSRRRGTPSPTLPARGRVQDGRPDG